MKRAFLIFKRWGTSVDNDWRVMFVVFLILLALAVAWGVSLFLTVAKTGEGADETSETLLNANALHRTALYYDARAARFELIRATSESTPDPSK